MILTDMNLTFPKSYTVLTGLIDVCLRGNLFCFDSSFTLKWKESLFVCFGFFFLGLKKSLLEKPSELMSHSSSFLSLTGFSVNQVSKVKNFALCF